MRLRSEVRVLLKCRSKGLSCPAVLAVRLREGVVYLQRVPGCTVAAFLKAATGNADEERVKSIAAEWGRYLSILHDKVNVIHGDLTTSNVMVNSDDDWQLTMIDFGLAQTTTNVEDRAVDLYVLERSVFANHADVADVFVSALLKSYAEGSKDCVTTLKRLEAVRLRGRKRTAFG